MVDTRFDAWTRRRFGRTAGGVLITLAGLGAHEDSAAKHKHKRKKKCKQGHKLCGKTCCKRGQKCNSFGECFYYSAGCTLLDNTCAGNGGVACPLEGGGCYIVNVEGFDNPVCLSSFGCGSKLGNDVGCQSDKDCNPGQACLTIQNPSGGICCDNGGGPKKVCVIFP
jgi:hypothetical protein